MESALENGLSPDSDFCLNLVLARTRVKKGKYFNFDNFKRSLEIASRYRELCTETEEHPEKETAADLFVRLCVTIFKAALQANSQEAQKWLVELLEENKPQQPALVIATQSRSSGIFLALMSVLYPPSSAESSGSLSS